MYISGESPATCVQVMPLLLAGISSNTGRESCSPRGHSELAFANGFRAAERCAAANALENPDRPDRKSTRLNSSHLVISYAVFCLKKKRMGCYSSHLVVPSRRS